jgi:hypothetical protein
MKRDRRSIALVVRAHSWIAARDDRVHGDRERAARMRSRSKHGDLQSSRDFMSWVVELGRLILDGRAPACARVRAR